MISRHLLPKLLLSLFCLTLFSCKLHKKQEVFYYGTFKFRQKPDEVYLKPSFVSFLKANPFCSVVLRVPVKTNTVIEEETYNNRSMYFAIEQQLITNNFRVNDRSIFERKYMSDSVSKSQTDLILELVDYRPINYYTNKVIPEAATEDKENTLPKYFYFTGAKAEFKIVHIKTNEVVAAFTLNYTPCTKGCKMRYTMEGHVEELEGDFKVRKKNGYDAVDTDDNFDMFNELARRLVFELRKVQN